MPFCPIKQYKQLNGVNRQVGKHLCQIHLEMPYGKWFESRHLQKVILPILLLLAVMPGGICTAVESQPVAAAANQQDLHQPIRVRIFNLRQISAQQAKDYLQSAQVADTVLPIPGTAAVSVTGNPEQLVNASTVIKLVDTNETFDIQFLDIAPNQSLPGSDKIEKKLGREYSVGSLMEGPAAGAAIKAIACLYKDKLLLITPAEQTIKITEAVQSLLVSSAAKTSQEKEKQPAAEPNQQSTEPKVASANEPPVIEPNKVEAVAGAKVTTEPNRPKTEDDMLGDFLTQLADTTKAEKPEQKAQTAKAEPNLLPKVAAEPAIEQPKTAEQQPVVSQTEKPQEKLPEKTSVSFQQPVAEAEETEQAVPSLDIPNGNEMLELNLPEKLEIVALIDLVGKYLNLNYLYDETKVTGSVTIKVQGKLKVRELYDLLESVLKFRGFSMSRKGKLVTIVPAGEALDQDPTFAEGIKPGDVVVTKIFHLQYITTAAAKGLLNGMKLGTNSTEIPESGTLVITEYAFRMQRIEDLLSIIDVPGPPKEFKLRVLNYTLADALVPKIQALAEQLGTVNITIGTTTTATPAATAQSPRASRGRQPAQPQAQSQPAESSAKKTSVFIDFDKRTNRILMIGLRTEIAAVEQIVDSLDVPQQDLRVVREYEMQYVDIDKVTEALKEFGIIESTAGAASTVIPSVRIPAGAQQPQAAAAGGTTSVALDQPQIVKLESTNSLLVNATPEQHIQISRVISYIDREPVQAAIPYRIYRLENQEPEKLAEVLNNLIEKTVKDKEGKIQSTVKYTEDNIAIVPDKGTFSLIVYASRKNQEWIGNLIQSLDRRRPQVLIDVSLVEITRDNEFSYDLSTVVNPLKPVTGNLAITGGQLVTSATGTHVEGGFDLTDSSGNFLGAVRGFYSNSSIQTLLTLIDKKNYGRILAKPKVLVNDNEQGDILTSERTYVSSTTSTYPGTTTGTTLVPVTTQTWTPYEAKIELKITPQISEGDLLRLEIAMTREDFENLAAAKKAGSPPDYATSNVNTIVTVPDGSTIILGGLTKLNQTKSVSKVPLLGDIPVAGALFRSPSKIDSESKLYIFVKANILRPEQAIGLGELKNISRTNKTEFETEEGRFQRHELVPGVKEKPLEPKNVLEQGEEVNEPQMPTSADSAGPSRK